MASGGIASALVGDESSHEAKLEDSAVVAGATATTPAATEAVALVAPALATADATDAMNPVAAAAATASAAALPFAPTDPSTDPSAVQENRPSHRTSQSSSDTLAQKQSKRVATEHEAADPPLLSGWLAARMAEIGLDRPRDAVRALRGP